MSTASLPHGPRAALPFQNPEEIMLKIGDVLIGPLWVLEWSQAQQAFHVETLLDHLQTNLLGFFHEGRTGDYVILGVFQTREAVDGYYELCVERMKRWGISNLTPEDLLRDLSP